MFDIKKLISLYKENLDEGRIYLYNNMGLFMDNKKLQIRDEDIESDLFMKLDNRLQHHHNDFCDDYNSKQRMRMLSNKGFWLLMDILRYNQRENSRQEYFEIYEDDEGDSNEQEYAIDSNFIQEQHNSFAKDIIHKAILELPEEEMRLLALMLDEYGYTQVDIARMQGINFRKISKIYQSALVHLREKLQGLEL